MAIVRTAGTEIIRSIHLEEVDSTERVLIFGVQHHIYTVLSIIVSCRAVQATSNKGIIYLIGYDSSAGTTGQALYMVHWSLVANETFVWNDKFSFNGTEPTDFAGPMDDATKQDAIADQGSSVAQKLVIYTTHADDEIDVHCTFIDQNNA